MRYLIIVILLSSSVRAQPLTQTQKLASLAKIWGFFKYYHPAVATGKLDWDGQLIRLIPAVEKAQDRQQLSALYQTLLQELGPVKPCRKCLTQPAPSINGQPNLDLSFLADSLVLTSTLRYQLNYLKNNRYQGDNDYAKLELAGNLSFENEEVYFNTTQPNTDYWLIALFRYCQSNLWRRLSELASPNNKLCGWSLPYVVAIIPKIKCRRLCASRRVWPTQRNMIAD